MATAFDITALTALALSVVALAAAAWRVSTGNQVLRRQAMAELIWSAVPPALLVLLLALVGPFQHG